MKLWLLFILVLTVAVSVVAAVPACPIVYPVVKKAVIVEKAVVTEVITPVAVFVPTFTVGYSPSPPAPVLVAAGPGTAEVLAELRRLNQRLDAIERARAPVMAPPPASVAPTPIPPVRTALGVYQAKCAACHQKGRESDGGGFVLLDQAGQRVQLDDRQRSRMMSLAYGGQMPPKKTGVTLDDAEVMLIMADLR